VVTAPLDVPHFADDETSPATVHPLNLLQDLVGAGIWVLAVYLDDVGVFTPFVPPFVS
jgi:hypothetical protein